MNNSKDERMLEIFFRAIRGEELSVRGLADEYGVSTRSITRDLNNIKAFISNHMELMGNAELLYDYQNRKYRLDIKGFLQSNELLALVKILIGCRGLSNRELLDIIAKLKNFVSCRDKKMMQKLVSKEVYHYHEVRHDCDGVISNLWKLATLIDDCKEITISYYKMNRETIERRVVPYAIVFSEYYFYLIAYHKCEEEFVPRYYRLDRITHITVHRVKTEIPVKNRIDEGLLKNEIQYMWPGQHMKVKFKFTGPSVQAILDRIPTAKIIEVNGNEYTIEAETYGTGIKMFLLSQGKWVKVISPEKLVNEMKQEISQMVSMY